MKTRPGFYSSKRLTVFSILGCALLLISCGDATTPTTREAASDTASESYVVMGDDLAALKTDFNAAVDQVRLLFIVGPT